MEECRAIRCACELHRQNAGGMGERKKKTTNLKHRWPRYHPIVHRAHCGSVFARLATPPPLPRLDWTLLILSMASPAALSSRALS